MSIQRNSMKVALAATLMGSLLLVACGGDSDDNSVPPTAVPTTVATATPTTVAATPTPTTVAATPTPTDVAVTPTPTTVAATPTPTTVAATPTTAPGVTTTTWTPGSELASYLVGGAITSGTNTNFTATTAEFTVNGMSFWSKTAGSLRLFNDATAGNAVNYNGNSFDGTPLVVGASVTIADATRYVALPYTATAGEVSMTVSYTFAASTTAPLCADAPSQIAIADATGKILAVQTVCAYTTDRGSLTTSLTSATNNKLYVLFSRNGAGGGGIRVWSISSTK